MRSNPAFAQQCTDKHLFSIAIIAHAIILALFFITVDRDIYSGLEALIFIFKSGIILIFGHLELLLLIPSELEYFPRHFCVKNYLLNA